MSETTNWTVTLEITVRNAQSREEALATVDGSLRSMFAKYALCDVVKEILPQDDTQVCTWTYRPDWVTTEYWETSCGHSFILADGTPADNEMKFCPYCGRQLEEKDEG